MAYAPTRSRAKRPPFSSFADQLYPEDDPRESVTEGPEEDAGGEQDDAAEGSPLKRLSQKEMAEKVYPADAKSKDEADDAGGDGDDEGSADEEGAEDKEPGAEDEPAQGENGQAAQGAANRLHAVLGMFGVKPSSEQNSKEAEGAAKLEAGMRKAIADAEASKGGPLTPDEEQNITGEYIANHAMKWLRLKNIAADKLSEAMWNDAGHEAKSNCGTFFREHFKPLGGNMEGRKSSAAKDWGPELEKNGYEPVSQKNYEPKDGDIRIYGSVTPRDPKSPKQAELYGHIQVYNAKQQKWVSEYKQNQEIPPAFQRSDAQFVTYRFNPF